MVVGDDDQAIYAFQGASVSNIQTFLELFPQTKIITLQDNYRSNQNILEASIQTAQQIEDRPTGTKLKLLQPQNKQIQNLEVEVVKLTDLSSELNWLTEDLKQQLKNGAKSEDIAVLAPKHKYLQELATTLQAAGIPVFYETSTNILEDEIIQELLSLSKLVLQIGAGDLASSNSLLAEVLSAPYWQLEPGSVWNLAVFASQQELKQHWLQHLKNGALGQPGIQIYHQLTFWGTLAQNLSLEQSLDLLIGVASNPPPESIPLPRERLGEGLSESIPPLGGHLTKGEGVGLSPFKNFYFSHTKLKQNPAAYANFLASLSSLRDHLRSYYPDQSSTKLKDLITYTDLCQAHGGIRLARSGLHIKPSGVNLITAYGSKGLEFDQVYLIHCLEDVWGQSARGKTDTLKLSSNFGAHQDSADDKTRLFYVAQTRAKTRLVQTLYKFDEKGKPKTTLRYLEPLSSLIGIKLKDFSEESLDAQESAQAYQQTLFNPPASIPLPRKACPELAEGEGLGEGESDLPPQLANILQPLLQNYRLSPTHLNTWLDEEYGGPEEFITRHLLRFPQAMSESAIHGSAVHKALEKAHLSSKGSAKENSLSSLLLTTYQTELNKSSLDPQTRSRMLQKAEFLFNNLAEDILSLVSVNAKSEVDIKANFGEVKLSGKLDAIVITKEDSGEQTAIIRDYKTGKPKNKIEERYKHQLYFYKLLLDLAPERLPKNTKLKGAELVYLHPTEESIVTLSLEYNQEEYEQFKKLIKQTWTEIMNLGLG
jgi:DNA helicase-2/ATP-dependent DNA helicase PcrA